jgi:gas vesicle protein
MKNQVDSKLLLGLVIGAVVGVAVGYLAATDKKDQILGELNNLAGKVKESFTSAVNKYTNKCESAVEEVDVNE